MKKRTHLCYSGKMKMDDNIDFSLLRKPLTPFTGFQEARNAFDKGTAEVRQLLLYECSLIYECNVCRNMFRSLANFISHKRLFCTNSFKEYIQRSHDPDEKLNKKSGNLDLKQPKAEKKSQEKYAKSQTANLVGTDAEFHEHQNNYGDNRTKSTGQCLQSADLSNQYSMPTYIFQCPSCSLNFLKSSSVIRHLAVAHNVSIRRIRMMRNSILKNPTKPIKKEDCQQSQHQQQQKLVADLKTLQSSQRNISTTDDDDDDDKKQNVEKEKLLSKCGYCRNVFENRTALSKHLQGCPIKSAMLEPHTSSVKKNKRMKLQATTPTSLKPAVAADIDSSQFDDANVEDVKQTFVDLENKTFGTGLHTVSFDKFDICESTNDSTSMDKQDDLSTSTSISETKLPEENLTIPMSSSNVTTTKTTRPGSVFIGKKQRKTRTSTVAKQSCRCKICGKAFNALSNLRRHISMFHYRARKFGCALCEYCAFRRYDIINHLNFVHNIQGDHDKMSSDYVKVNEVPYTKEDMDDDILICSDDELKVNLQPKKLSSSVEELRGNRKEKMHNNVNAVQSEKSRNQFRLQKNSISLDETNVTNNNNNNKNNNNNNHHNDTTTYDVKVSRQKLKRSHSQVSISSIEETPSHKTIQKRPTRNRTKTVNTDFVYDMKDLLNKSLNLQTNTSGETEIYHLRGSRRRNTLHANVDMSCPPVPGFDAIKAKNYVTIRGTARRTSLLLVNQGLAASSTLPEIPSERPLMRPRVTSVQRNDSNNTGCIIETVELDASRLKSLPLCDDLYLEKITKESVGSFEMKPCLAQQQHTSALDTLLQKVDSTLQLNGNGNINTTTTTNTGIIESIEGVEQLTVVNLPLLETDSNYSRPLKVTLSQCFTTPEQPIPKAFTMPTLKPKRLSSLNCLTEAISSLENYYQTALEK